MQPTSSSHAGATAHPAQHTTMEAFQFNWQSRASCAGCLSTPDGYEMKRVSRIFLALCSIEWLLLLSIASALLVLDHEDGTTNDTVSVYAWLSIFVVFCHGLFTWDAIIAENKFQFISSEVLSALMTFTISFFVWVHPQQLGSEWVHVLRFVIFSVRGVMQIVYIALAKNLVDTFGYVKYKIAGADARIGALYEEFRIFLSLLKIDFVMFGFLLLLAKAFMLKTDSPEFIVGATSAGVAVLWSFLGWLGVVSEVKPLVYVFVLCSLLQPAWVAFKLWRVEEHPTLLPQQIALWQFALIGGLFVLTRCGTLYMTHRCFRNFGQGLREGVFLAVASREAKAATLSSAPTNAAAVRKVVGAQSAEAGQPLLRGFEDEPAAPVLDSQGQGGNPVAVARLQAMYQTGNFNNVGNIQQAGGSRVEMRQPAREPSAGPASERLAQFMHDYE